MSNTSRILVSSFFALCFCAIFVVTGCDDDDGGEVDSSVDGDADADADESTSDAEVESDGDVRSDGAPGDADESEEGCASGCGGDLFCCSDQCVDLEASAEHCGACDNACTGLVPGCCEGECFDLARTRRHCGECGRSCDTSQVCNGGECTDI